MSAEVAGETTLGMVVVALAARRFMGLSDQQLKDLAAYLKTL